MAILRVLDQIVENARSVFRSSSIAAQQAAVVEGLGLEVLHVFAAGQDPRPVRILANEVEARRSYWLVTMAGALRGSAKAADGGRVERVRGAYFPASRGNLGTPICKVVCDSLKSGEEALLERA